MRLRDLDQTLLGDGVEHRRRGGSDVLEDLGRVTLDEINRPGLRLGRALAEEADDLVVQRDVPVEVVRNPPHLRKLGGVEMVAA